MRTGAPTAADSTGTAVRFLLGAVTLLSAVLLPQHSFHAGHDARLPQRAFLPRHHHAPRIRDRSTTNSSNWAGYAVTGSNFTDIVATWQVPKVQPGGTSDPSTYSAVWVGIDGDTSNSVEQCGTEQDYTQGQAQYSAWFEIYPSKFNVTLDPTGYPVAAGDFINAEVKYLGNNQFFLSLTSSQGWTATTTQTYAGAQLSSAEWIVEAPSTARSKVLPLADFGQATLSGCKAATGSGPLAPIGNWTGNSIDQITMGSMSTTLASTGALTGQDSFNVLWQSY
jgi:hypothetical protein